MTLDSPAMIKIYFSAPCHKLLSNILQNIPEDETRDRERGDSDINLNERVAEFMIFKRRRIINSAWCGNWAC